MTISRKRRLFVIAAALLFLWALAGAYLAYESQRDVRDIHRDLREEAIMDEQAERMRKLTLAHPDIWEREHPRTYESLLWLFVRHGLLSDSDAKTSVAFDDACSPDYRILLKYVSGENEPILTNSRIEILGIR